MASTPKTNQKLAIRTLLGVIVLGGLFLGYRKFESLKGDFDRAPANTSGMILAIRVEDDGQRVVTIRPDGTVVENPGWTPGTVDRDATWTPDGNRVYFVSDRESKEAKIGRGANVFRWNPATNEEPNQRSTGTGGRSNPAFPDEPGVTQSPLITSRGFVNEFDPVTGATRQLLPPRGREVAQVQEEGAGGAGSQLTGLYGALGTSFRLARWCGGGGSIVTIMTRDEGEVAVLQSMDEVPIKQPDGTSVPGVAPPLPVVAGDRIDVAVSPKDGSVVLCVRGFDYPTEDQRRAAARNGRVRKPFENGILIIDPKSPQPKVLLASTEAGVAFSSPAVAPDGSQIVFTAGVATEDGYTPGALVTAPFREGGDANAQNVFRGEVFEPSYTPDGKEILFAHRADRTRRIKRFDRESGRVSDVTKDGNFSFPRLSPQSAGK